MFSNGFITDSVKIVQASTEDWHLSPTTTPQVMKFDTLGYGGALVLVNTGTAVDSAQVALSLTQSDTQNGTFTTVTGSEIANLDDGSDNGGNLAVFDVANVNQRWLAVRAVKTGTTASVQVAVTVVLYHVGTTPVTNATTSSPAVAVRRILNA
jgi:hypothetical protein